MTQPEAPAEVRLQDVPARLFLESQDHQHDLIRELMLIEIGERFDLTDLNVPQQLAKLISDILNRYADVRWVTRQQALRALDQGEELVTMTVPVRPGMADALREWLRLLEEADRFCEQGDLLTLAARPAVRQLRRWYVREIVSRLPSEMP
ncbi:MAG: hypothetical protein M3N52_03630 [Actinomycetota bacterium]|nr:hypothetical protein [Actinomycetota bacterium]